MGLMKYILFACLVVALSRIALADPPSTVPSTQPSISSKPVEHDGLQVTVTMPKATFAADEPLKFTLQFKNVSGKPLTLCDADCFWHWVTQFTDVKAGGPWTLRQLFDDRHEASVNSLKPDGVLEVPVELVGGKRPFDLQWDGPQKRLVAPIQHLRPGKYRLTIEISLRETPVRGPEDIPPFWVGTTSTEPVEFEITDKPAASTTQPTTQAGPVTEAQATELAAKFADKNGWGKPTGVSQHGEDYWVGFETPKREGFVAGHRTVIVNAVTGTCRFMGRD